jgi:iron complex outermembrane receptor protein
MTVYGAAPATRGAIFARRLVAPLAISVAIALSPVPAAAQSACASAAPPAVRVAVRHWPAPLDRHITLQGDNVTLRDGLARLATAARVRLSYVAELLPLDRPLCLAYRSVAAGEVLTDLLRGTELEPVVAGDDQVVLAPARRTADATFSDDVDARRTSVLDRVVVTGTTTQTVERSTTIALDVVSGDRLARQESGSLTHLLDGSVPGIWMWQQAPTTLLARYGSVRGASSFGLSYPKIYIDGIEVANPLIVRQFDPSTIERVEVIRGPQGAALYGADANSGVINIITRHDGTAPGGQRLELESTAGVSGSQFAPQGVLTQQHALAFRTGTSERSAGLGISIGTLGAYVPGAFANTLAANGNMRLVGARSVFTGTARLFSERAGTPSNPLLPSFTGMPGGGLSQRSGSPSEQSSYAQWGPGGTRPDPMSAPFGTSFVTDTTRTQSVSEYTVGGTLAFAPNGRWLHTFVLGLDGYRLANPAITDGPLPTATDSALEAARGGGDRVTARVTSTARFGAIDRTSTLLTFTAEHGIVREQSMIVSTNVGQNGGYGGPGQPGETASEGEARLVGWRGNSGLVAQANTSLRHRFFLTAGLRLERDDALVGSTRVTSLPMLGGAVVADRGDVTVKLRAAYGMGIRPVQGAIRELAWSGRRAALVAYDLAPEQQSGVETGADLFIGRTLAFHVTRFDQQATGLIQSVAVTVPDRSPSRGLRYENAPLGSDVAYQLQNVGAIANRGWELQSAATFGRLSVGSALSLVDSRVERLASGYTGDLRAGDRMLDVPAHTTSLSGAWTAARWFGSLTLSRAGDWTGYDRVAIANALTSGGVAPHDLVGDRLRGYWRDYDGVTRVRANVTRDLFRGLSLVLVGDNLLGQQRGEPDNATIVPGRTVTAGIKAKF